MSRIFQVGDEAELGPVLMNRFLAEVTAQGGKVVLKGNKAIVVYAQPIPAEEPVVSSPIVEEEPPPAPAPKKTASRKKASSPPEE